MKTKVKLFSLLVAGISLSFPAIAQTQPSGTQAAAQTSTDAKTKSDADIQTKAADWVSSLKLNDAAKEARVKDVIANHLMAVREWNNTHSYESVPAGINPVTGKALSVLDRQVIINSTIPKSVHENLMTGLHKDLSEEQVDAILDKYTEGKVAFTLAGYKSIVPDLSAVEEATILANLKQAREEAVDFKGSKQISAIFKIYKTKNEAYLNENGRNWHQLFKNYVDAVKAKKGKKTAEN
ncbi:hypothetical protein GALL_536380 [mine drainage metagenome]|uniref:DUF3826 domain-containing protein n=1 Tax=mine drainage metagenome TaxID=410659 RepID=A0A1J5NZV0_9ZZZZ